MTEEELNKEIEELQSYIRILRMSCTTEEEQVIQAYIKTESLPKTKKIIDSMQISMKNGNKYQLNDIRDLVLRGADGYEEANNLAYRIYRANKKKGGQINKYAKSRTHQG